MSFDSRWVSAVLACVLLLGAGLVGPDVVRVGAFSEANLEREVPEGWRPIAFDGIEVETHYDLVRSDSGVVVRARSNGGAAGLVAERRIDLTEYPILEWSWKIDGIVENGDARTKDGDDYSARLYVMFDYEDLGFLDQIKLTALRALGYDEIPTRALNYIWANRVDRGTVLESVYTDWVMMVAVRSGAAQTGTWRTERRNVLKDYRAVFGGTPPPVDGVALMTDTDDTGGRATAYYGDIVFRSLE